MSIEWIEFNYYKGTMTFGTQWIDIMGKCEKDEAQAMFNKYVDLGGN